MKKKEYKRLARAIADEESKAPAESQGRQERIKVVWHAITSGDLARDAKDLAENELVRSLVELVLLQKLEIKYLTRFRRDWERILAYYPEQLENLSGKSLMAEVLPFIKERVVKKRPKQVYEQKRRGYQWGGGEIQRGFGDASAVALPPGLDSPLLRSSDYYCLDDIFLCRRVNMVKLQRFFGLHRNRFPNELPSVKEGRELLYNYRAVVRIMEALLSEKRGEHKNPDARETTAPVAQKSRSSNSRAQGNRGADNEVCYRTAEEDGDPPEG